MVQPGGGGGAQQVAQHKLLSGSTRGEPGGLPNIDLNYKMWYNPGEPSGLPNIDLNCKMWFNLGGARQVAQHKL